MPNTYSHLVEVELGCGCKMDTVHELVEGAEPDAESAMMSVARLLVDADFLEFVTDGWHMGTGAEQISFNVSTKIGSMDEVIERRAAAREEAGGERGHRFDGEDV